ncbi:MAG: thioredoxin family protein [Chitinophagaceae bacterium]|jgi:thiol:disulfide interchange protein DsbD|nr:thioredoxin family protein [Chitinophagaceae bacterium]
MKSFFLFLLIIGISQLVNSQTTDSLVKTTIHTQRMNDSIVLLTVKANLEKGFALFTTHKKNPDDAFVSSFHLDSSLNKYLRSADSIKEFGTLQSQNDSVAGGTVYFYTDSVTFQYTLHIPKTDSVKITGAFSWLGKQKDEFPSGDVAIDEKSYKKIVAEPNATAALSDDDIKNKSLLWIFLRGLVTGMGAVFTPCVYPLIPVTVSFFLKRSKSRAEGIKSTIAYSLSIILIYTIPAIIITLIFGDKALYQIATSPISNLLFFTIFIIFAISFFGAFEIQLPGSWANKTDAQASKGGLMGIFFMALTLVIVSFSCTGPIAGWLFGQISSGGISAAPVLGMLGFSAGLALPFSLFAFSPSLLHSLPKSGGWLNSVKIFFGFLELALAMKFLSNVDLIYGWHLLNRDVYLSIWIVLAVLLGLYLLGKIKFSHDSDMKFVSIPRLFLAIASFCFAVYMLPGLWGAPLKSLSGILPPAHTQDFNLDDLQYKIGNTATAVSKDTNAKSAIAPKLYTGKLRMPFGIVGYFDFDEGMAAAKALNKPVMLDFTGHSCANCRKMENEVWSNPEVLKRMKEDFVVISLYVDDPSDLPDNQIYTNKSGEKITTLGKKNLDYEIAKFGFNAQPLYMFLDLNGNVLGNTVAIDAGYNPDINAFIKRLDEAKKIFVNMK